MKFLCCDICGIQDRDYVTVKRVTCSEPIAAQSFCELCEERGEVQGNDDALSVLECFMSLLAPA